MAQSVAPPAPVVGDIPQAWQLHQQLDVLLTAVDYLRQGGNVAQIMVTPPPAAPGGMMMGMMGSTVILNPPISDPETLAVLTDALLAQAAAIAEQLDAMGYDAAGPRQRLAAARD
jgi:hypothetical protein